MDLKYDSKDYLYAFSFMYMSKQQSHFQYLVTYVYSWLNS